MINGKRTSRTFKDEDDVFEVVDLIIEETKEFSISEKKEFDLASSVMSQIPHFACKNIFYDNNIQKDIRRYIYCEKFGVSPYNGSYGDQPFKWVKRAFAIKSAIAKKEKRDIDAARSK